MAKLPTVDIRVVPFEGGWHPGLEAAFLIVEFETASPVVHLELRDTGLFESIDLIEREAKRIERIA